MRACPRVAEVLDWLRVEHNIHHSVDPCFEEGGKTLYNWHISCSAEDRIAFQLRLIDNPEFNKVGSFYTGQVNAMLAGIGIVRINNEN